MNLVSAFASIRQIGVEVFRTSDVVAKLHISTSHASKLLRRLSDHGFLIALGRGRWALEGISDPLIAAESLVAPYPAYVSMQSALYYRGIIEQIPVVRYMATLGKTRRIETALGTFSFHHLTAEFFFGFEVIGTSGVKIALAEKALLDTLYLGQFQPKLFGALPEIELPRDFSVKLCSKFIERLNSKRLKTILFRELDEVLGSKNQRTSS